MAKWNIPIGSVLWFFLMMSTAYSQNEQLQQRYFADDSLRIERSVSNADSLFRLGEIQQSIQILKSLAQEADSLDRAYLIQLVNSNLAEHYLAADQYQVAEQVIRDMLNRYADSDHVADAYFTSLLGRVYRSRGEYKKALDTQLRAKSMADSAQYPKVYSKIEIGLGQIYESTGNLAAAFNHYLQGVEIAEILNDSLLLATGLNSIGVSYNDYEKFEEAKYYLERAQAINQKLNNKIGLLYALNNLAISHKGLGNTEKAISLYNNALELHQEIRKEVPPFRILYNLGQLNKDIGELDKAEEYFRQSLSYSESAGLKQGLMHNFGALANVAELRDNYSKAREYYSKALDIAREVGANSLKRLALFSLSNLEEKRGNFKEALSYYKRYATLSDSLEKEQRQQAIEEVETRLGLREQEEVNRLLQEKQEQQQARIMAQNWLIGISGLTIVLIFLSTVILYRSNRDKKRINGELNELNGVKDKMMGIIAHDLRSPMTSMQGIFYLLKDDDLQIEEIREIASNLEVSVQQNINMMDNLLSWANSQMSGIEVNVESLSVYKLVEKVLMNSSPMADQKSIILSNEIDPDLKVKADANMLQIIVRNLVNNAIKFTSEGEVITISSEEKEGNAVLKVMDTGIGIPEEEQDKIFSLQSTSRPGTNNERGSGLGLRLCKEFVEKQGGSIYVESSEGEGSTFYVSLPQG